MAQTPRYANANVMRTSLRPYYLMGALIAALLVVTAGAGVFVEGIYMPFLSETLVAFQFFQDMLSLAFAPVLLTAMYFAGRGSARALVVWAGALVYVLYYYSFYGLDNLSMDQLSMYVFLAIMGSVGLALYMRNLEDRPVREVRTRAQRPLGEHGR